jgi:hypothetical protein
MQGRRRQPGMKREPGGKIVPTIPWDDMKPGDYCGPILGFTGDKPAVFFLKPNARDTDAPPNARSMQHVVSPPHVFTEEPDGTLTITASISDRRANGGESDGWHGYLTAGVWVQV